jgi:hypothetical protein
MENSTDKLRGRACLVAALSWILLLSPFTVHSASSAKPTLANAYTLAGVVLDRSRKVKSNETTAEVKVVEKVMPKEHAGKSYDVVFLVLPDAIQRGEILTLTSAPVASCRPYLKTFLTKTLSPKRIAKAYKGAKLATSDNNKTAAALSKSWLENRWLRNCSAKPEGKVDAFKVLIVSEVGN